jgi:hypothetical protein
MAIALLQPVLQALFSSPLGSALNISHDTPLFQLHPLGYSVP